MFKKIQGIFAEKLFHGLSGNKTIKLVYGESADLFSKIITNTFKRGQYSLLDLGSHRGEFLDDVIKKLPEFTFSTTAIDINEEDIKINSAQNKITGAITNLPFDDKSFDITLARYCLAWNNVDDQIKILNEIKRVTKDIAIIQHQGADKNNPVPLQKASKALFSGSVDLLKRDDFYFSTTNEIKQWLDNTGIKYEVVQERKVEGLSGLLIEKYSLDESNKKITKDILQDCDYILQSTFVLDFRN